MAEMSKTVTLAVACPECGETVELQQTTEFEKLLTYRLEDDRDRMLYKVKSSMASEVHLCTGEKKWATGGIVTAGDWRKTMWGGQLGTDPGLPTTNDLD